MKNSVLSIKTIFTKEFLLVFFFVILSGNPYVLQNLETAILFLFLFLIFFKSSVFLLTKNDYTAFLIIIYFLIFEVIHRFLFNLDNLTTILRVAAYFLTAYFFIKATILYFKDYYVKVIYFLAIISILFYILGLLAPSIYNYLSILASKIFVLRKDYNDYSTPTFILYTFDPTYANGETSILRNPGFAWESGGFAFFLNIALFFHLAKNEAVELFTIIKDKISLLLLIAIILTFSTAGYITFIFILFMLSINRLTFKNILFSIILIFLIVFFYDRLDFIGQKLNSQLQEASYSQNRFGSALLDLQDFKKSPLFGWSRDINVLFKTVISNSETHRPNGITNFLRSYGIIYFISYFIIIFLSLKKYFTKVINRKKYIYTILFLMIVFLMGFSQQVVHTIFMMNFLFWGILTDRLKI